MISRLRDTRRARGLTQVQLATLAAVDQTTISALELHPDRDVSWKTVFRLARALRVRPEFIFPVSRKRAA